MKRKILVSLPLFMLTLLLMAIPVTGSAVPDSLTPYELTASLIPQDETHPYGSALLTFKINDLPRPTDDEHWYVLIEKKIGQNDWKTVDELSTDLVLDMYEASPGVFTVEQLWVEDYDWKSDIPISFRASVLLYDNTFSILGSSATSNIATIGLQGSGWAIPELEKAIGYGLVPDSLAGKDLTKPITREEFCETALLLYEKSMGESPAPASPNPFTDTTNPQILKAFALKITTGTSTTTFSPNDLINREQCATMLSRAIRAMVPDGDFSTSGAPTFNDQKDISSWALEHVMYMSKLGIIKGTNGNFMPKATTTAQQAAGYATTTREQAIAMSVRIYDQYDTIKETVGSNPSTPPAGTSTEETADFNGTWGLTVKHTGENMVMAITQNGTNITGIAINGDSDSINFVGGSVQDKILTMKFSYIGNPDIEFDVVYTMADDNQSFNGTWKYPGYTWEITGTKQ